MLKSLLLIGAAAVSFPALAQTTEPAGDEVPPVAQPAPEPTDSAEPAPTDTPTDRAEPAPSDGDTPDEPAPQPEPEPESGS